MKEKLQLMMRTHPVAQPVTRRCLQKALALALMLVVSLSATAQRFGNWEVESNSELTATINRNSSDAVLGYACVKSSNTCHFFFTPDKLTCTEGSRYALLFNGGRMSAGRSSVCRRLGDDSRHEFANVIDDVAGLSKQLLAAEGSILGIARGTGSDGFTVSRFNMQGFREAFDRVNRDRNQSGNRGSVGDSKL